MAAKKKASVPDKFKAPAARAKPEKTAAPAPAAAPKKGRGTGLKIHPDEAKKAINLLAEYVAERVELARDKVRLGDTVAAVRLMAAIDDLKTIVGDRIKSPLEDAYNTLRLNVVPGIMEDEGIEKITVDEIGRVNVIDDVQVQVLVKDDLLAWLTENDHEDLIKPSVHAQTLAAFVRAAIKAGKSQDGKGLPKDHVLKVTPIVRAQITRQ